MKVRTGFVSNNSSTSFLIIYDKAKLEGKRCECCGHKPPDLFTLLERGSNYSGDDTQLNWRCELEGDDYEKWGKESVEEKLAELKRELVQLNIDLESPETDPRYIPGIKEQVAPLEKKIATIEEALDNHLSLASFYVSYHDEIVENAIKEAEKQGRITILERYS